MHLSRILDQIKRHPSPTEALTKLGKAMDKHEDNLLEKGFRILKSDQTFIGFITINAIMLFRL